MVTLLDNRIETVQAPTMDDLISAAQTPHDKFSLLDAAARRTRQNARRLKNWTGAYYVKVETAD